MRSASTTWRTSPCCATTRAAPTAVPRATLATTVGWRPITLTAMPTLGASAMTRPAPPSSRPGTNPKTAASSPTARRRRSWICRTPRRPRRLPLRISSSKLPRSTAASSPMRRRRRRPWRSPRSRSRTLRARSMMRRPPSPRRRRRPAMHATTPRMPRRTSPRPEPRRPRSTRLWMPSLRRRRPCRKRRPLRRACMTPRRPRPMMWRTS
mmetsp:Transcript_4362/g.12127  ORF Transcript_4362/g.12127 Transcript_4362/m.12127 type:complete len:209 (+) Transcript_4362:2193-2819(+)